MCIDTNYSEAQTCPHSHWTMVGSNRECVARIRKGHALGVISTWATQHWSYRILDRCTN